MARYFTLNGDRITGIVNWDGKSPHPYGGDVTLKKAPDGIGADWVGKSYDEAVKAGNAAKKDGDIHPADDAKEGRREAEIKAAQGGLHHSGEVFNGPADTIAAEHPLDPVLGSVMRTPQPELNVAIVPASQPKTDEQAAKDAGETPVDRAKARVAEQEARASHVRPPTSRPAPTDDEVKRSQPRRSA